MFNKETWWQLFSIVNEIDSGLLSHESILCSSCEYNNQQLEDVRKELVKVLLQSNQNNDKAKIDLEQANASLLECKNKLKNMEIESAKMKNDFKTKTYSRATVVRTSR